MNSKKDKYVSKWWTIFLIILLGILFVWYGRYINLAKCTIPYSDYFQWTERYGEKILNNSLTAADYFKSDNGEHIQPLLLYLSIKVLEKTNFNYATLVTSGFVVRCFAATGLAFYLYSDLRRKKNISLFQISVCSSILAFSFLDFNQWEITTESFSLGNSIRVIIYFVSFAVANRWIAELKRHEIKWGVISGAFFGISISCITVFIGAGYFVGHVLAIGCVFLYVLCINIKNIHQYLFPMMVWAIATLVGCIIYVILIFSGERHSAVMISPDIIGVLIGIFVFWGAAILPVGLFANEYGLILYAIIGTIVFIAMLVIVVKYLRLKGSTCNMFPIYCIFYANFTAIIIAIARISTFSYSTMASSRYVVESVFGIVGMVWILSEMLVLHITWNYKIPSVIGLVVMVTFLGISAHYEIKRAPYIRQYYDNLEIALLNYKTCSDETLTEISATSPERARGCLQFLEKEHLSIFSNSNSSK